MKIKMLGPIFCFAAALSMLASSEVCALDPSKDAHGPHAGFIRDNEFIAVEIAPGAGKDIAVYILDSHGIPATLKLTELSVLHVRSNNEKAVESALLCEPQKLEGFKCTLPASIVFQKGDRLNIKTSPEGKQTTTISFLFPFTSQLSHR